MTSTQMSEDCFSICVRQKHRKMLMLVSNGNLGKSGNRLTFAISSFLLLYMCPKYHTVFVSLQNLRCAIEGSKPLKLVLTGSCIPQTPLKEVKHHVHYAGKINLLRS